MKNKITVEQLTYKKETLELELLGICRHKIEKFGSETGVGIRGIRTQVIDVPTIGSDKKEYFLTNLFVDLNI